MKTASILAADDMAMSFLPVLKIAIKELSVIRRANRVTDAEIRSIREEERHEREKLLLRLENALLCIEKQLPSGKETKRLK